MSSWSSYFLSKNKLSHVLIVSTHDGIKKKKEGQETPVVNKKNLLRIDLDKSESNNKMHRLLGSNEMDNLEMILIYKQRLWFQCSKSQEMQTDLFYN